jgi:hypothetical protein
MCVAGNGSSLKFDGAECADILNTEQLWILDSQVCARELRARGACRALPGRAHARASAAARSSSRTW